MDIIKLEEAGGVFTNGEYPCGLTQYSRIGDWLEKFPTLDPVFVEKWAIFVNARYDLDVALKQQREKN